MRGNIKANTLVSDSNPVVWLEYPRLGLDVDRNDPRAPGFHCRTDHIRLRVGVYEALYSPELSKDSPAKIWVPTSDLGDDCGGGSGNGWVSAATMAAMQVRSP
jgi:hypothetical protein